MFSRSSIYLFYTQITENHKEHCKTYREGDKLYMCRYGQHKVLRVTPQMNCSVTGLKNHLRAVDEKMYEFFEYLEDL